MMNLRSVPALLAISSLLACATAIDDLGGQGALTAAGADSGGAGSVEEGGAPSVGGDAPRAGAPASAAGKPGSAGAPSAGGRAGGTGGRSGGTAGAGSATGGKGGTSGTAGGSAAGGPGSAGGPGVAPCDNAKDVPATASNTGEVGTVAAACFRTKAKFNALTCSSFDGRTLKVNGVISKCDGVATFAPAIDGWNYFDISAGMFSYAQVGWFCTLASC